MVTDHNDHTADLVIAELARCGVCAVRRASGYGTLRLELVDAAGPVCNRRQRHDRGIGSQGSG